MDADCTPGSCYDRDPRVAQGVVSRNGDRYFAVQHMDGHVVGYSMAFPEGTSLDEARRQIMAEFPADAQPRWSAVRDTCSQVQLVSPTLGAALGTPKIGDSAGTVVAEMDTAKADGTAGYDPSNINEGILTLGDYPTAGDAPGC